MACATDVEEGQRTHFAKTNECHHHHQSIQQQDEDESCVSVRELSW